MSNSVNRRKTARKSLRDDQSVIRGDKATLIEDGKAYILELVTPFLLRSE